MENNIYVNENNIYLNSSNKISDKYTYLKS